ncbi:hypothetical protein ABZZ74_52500 [Streptomyces sp. NPDC006476]|uniref:hypothetical protein n=1 Tax=Streptomyces sp. NPDC006476 TaxID=3157175 RepID=UPI00339DA935
MAVLAAVVAVILAGCGTQSTKSPSRHQERLRKAVGIEVFYIECSRDLRDVTSASTPNNDERMSRGQVKASKITKTPGGLSRIRLTGHQLADYLRMLDWRAPSVSGQAEAVRMYNEISRVLDGITSPPPADAPPLLVVDNGFIGTPSPTPTATATPTATGTSAS